MAHNSLGDMFLLDQVVNMSEANPQVVKMAHNSLGEMFLLDQIVNMSEANPQPSQTKTW